MKNEKKVLKNIFCDFHHAGLLNSLILLFEGRMGANVYRPIGTKWHKRGYWKVYDHPATVEQYLGIGGATPDGSEPLNEVITIAPPYLYYCQDIDSGQTNKAITYEGFMGIDFDIIVASIPQHIEPFRKLCNEHHSHSLLIYQIGNAWNITPEQEAMVDMILASAKTGYAGNKPYIEYHQEFDLNLFTENPAFTVPPRIASYVNCFSIDNMFREDWELFKAIERLMPHVEFSAYGGQCRDGAKHGAREVAESMKDQAFIWHTKKGGDGYGHIIHNAFAIGVPPIVKMKYYESKLAHDLMIDGDTCIAIDGLSPREIVNKIEHYSQIDEYRKLSDNAYLRFKEVVDFDKEAENIKNQIDNLLNA